MRTGFCVVPLIMAGTVSASPFVVSSGTGSVGSGDSYDYIAAQGTGEIIMTGGQATGYYYPPGADREFSIVARQQGVVRMSGGTSLDPFGIVGATDGGQFFFSGGTVGNLTALNGGTVEMSGGIVGTVSNGGAGSSGSFSISGGRVTGVTNATDAGMLISGGYFEGQVRSQLFSLLQITGGSFADQVRTFDSGSFAISGGRFESMVTNGFRAASTISGGRFIDDVVNARNAGGQFLTVEGGVFEAGIIAQNGSDLTIRAQRMTYQGQDLSTMVVSSSSDLLTQVVYEGVTYNALLGVEVQWLGGRVTTIDVYSEQNSYLLAVIPAPGVPTAALAFCTLVASRRRRG